MITRIRFGVIDDKTGEITKNKTINIPGDKILKGAVGFCLYSLASRGINRTFPARRNIGVLVNTVAALVLTKIAYDKIFEEQEPVTTTYEASDGSDLDTSDFNEVDTTESEPHSYIFGDGDVDIDIDVDVDEDEEVSEDETTEHSTHD